MTLPVLSGPVADEVTRRVRRSADEGVLRFAEEAPDDVDSTVEVSTEVTADDGRTVQVRLNLSFFAQGSAHPVDAVSTVVVRVADGSPVLLTDVLADTDRALAAALGHAVGVATQSGDDDPADKLTTRPQDWSDWQAGPEGMTFLFDDYQAGSHASGLREVQVPWSVVRPWLRDDAYALLGPSG